MDKLVSLAFNCQALMYGLVYMSEIILKRSLADLATSGGGSWE